MSRSYPYVSGFCSVNRHARCLGSYGAYARPAQCSCACHKASAHPAVDGQLELLEAADHGA